MSSPKIFIYLINSLKINIKIFLAHLGEALEDYMSQIPKVKIVRAPEREGLIKARIRGTLAAKAPTLTFLDSHVECAPGWLEPLLERIAINSTTVVCPVIDVITDSTLSFSYQSSEMLQVGGFEWEMTFTWIMVPQREKDRRKDASEPARSPTMAGGLFSIDTEFFKKLGMYDPGFDIWGAENLELSFKTWMCGGKILFKWMSDNTFLWSKRSFLRDFLNDQQLILLLKVR